MKYEKEESLITDDIPVNKYKRLEDEIQYRPNYAQNYSQPAANRYNRQDDYQPYFQSSNNQQPNQAYQHQPYSQPNLNQPYAYQPNPFPNQPYANQPYANQPNPFPNQPVYPNQPYINQALPYQPQINNQGFINDPAQQNYLLRCGSAVKCLSLTVIIQNLIFTFISFISFMDLGLYFFIGLIAQIVAIIFCFSKVKKGKATFQEVKSTQNLIVGFSAVYLIYLVIMITIYLSIAANTNYSDLIIVFVVFYVIFMVPRMIAIAVVNSRKLNQQNFQVAPIVGPSPVIY